KEGFERKALRSVSDRTYDRWLNNEVDPGKEHADFAYAVMKEILSRLEENPADGRSAVPAGASVSPSGVQPVEVAVRRALEKQFELEKWLHPDEQGRYDRYFRDAHKDLETL